MSNATLEQQQRITRMLNVLFDTTRIKDSALFRPLGLKCWQAKKEQIISLIGCLKLDDYDRKKEKERNENEISEKRRPTIRI
ncbi:CLUMA_CG010867, isoform A [Clunio marinus]|uniref:CLUMA_CG010867, isoform A n=1 Tax=Clunio marinus TaxID=568069 RepID=A0A1J1IEQ2_9DIPT|nr:CLUMA_CG010867, isoform A [Clunio marinus]